MSGTIKIATFNIRCVWDKEDKENSFIHRVGLVLEKINKEKPDVIAFQEVTAKIAEVLRLILPGYEIYGHGRGEDYAGDEGVYTAIKKETMLMCGLDIFWMSPTPYVPASRFEDQSVYPRTCVVTFLRHLESGKMFRIYNTHLDHIGSGARIQGIKCVLDKITEDKMKTPAVTVLLGDFNDFPDSEPIGAINEYTDVPLIDATKDIDITFHDFGKLTAAAAGEAFQPYEKHSVKIDYIFINREAETAVKEVKKWVHEKNGIYVSDHYPVSMEMELD